MGKKYLGTHDFSLANVLGLGGGPNVYESTVGATGADYATLGAAITAGKLRVLIIDDTTETANITLPSNSIIHGLGKNTVNINMGNFQFLDASGVNSNFEFNNLKITFAFTTSKNLFNNFQDINLYNIYFDNNSTAITCWAVYSASGQSNLLNVEIDVPNLSSCGFYLGGNTGTYRGIIIHGGGSACESALTVRNIPVYDVYLDGTFKTTTRTVYIDQRGSIIGMKLDANSYIHVYNGSSLVNALGSFSTLYSSGNYCRITDCHSTLTCTVTLACWYSSITGLTINGGTTTISGGQNKLTNSFLKALTVSADDNSVSNSQFNSNTITVSSGADRTIISGCRTNTAISDSGTDTVGIGNVVY